MRMIDNLNFIEELDKLNLPKDRFIIIGSAPLVIKNIIDTNGDLDIMVKEDIWNLLKKTYPINKKYVNNLLKEYIQIENIEIMHIPDSNFSKYKTVDDMIKNADKVDGYLISSLEDTIYYKNNFKRDKDIEQIKLIKAYLNKSNLE